MAGSGRTVGALPTLRLRGQLAFAPCAHFRFGSIRASLIAHGSLRRLSCGGLRAPPGGGAFWPCSYGCPARSRPLRPHSRSAHSWPVLLGGGTPPTLLLPPPL